jgi:copper chaperone CopZ
MTCAACVGAITEELKKKDWIRGVAVNLISNSATVDFVGEEHKNDLVESIEDIGYDAVIDSIVDEEKLHGPKAKTNVTSRTVEIKLDGMYCTNCPHNIKTALNEFTDRVHIDKMARYVQCPFLFGALSESRALIICLLICWNQC